MFAIDSITKSIKAKTSLVPIAAVTCVTVYNDISVDLSNVSIGPTELRSTLTNTFGDIVPTVVADQKRNLIYASIYNPNVETHNIFVGVTDSVGPTTTALFRCELKTLWRAEYNIDRGWKVYDENGRIVESLAKDVRILAQANPGAVLTSLLTVSTDKRVKASLVICNRSNANKAYRIAVSPNGAAIIDAHYINYDSVITANDTQTTPSFELQATDVVRVYGSTVDISFTINGNEY